MGEDARHQLVQLVAVPPPVHVGLPERQGTACKHPAVEIVIVHVEVPRPVSVYPDVRNFQEPRSDPFCRIHCYLPRFRCIVVCSRGIGEWEAGHRRTTAVSRKNATGCFSAASMTPFSSTSIMQTDRQKYSSR